MTGTNRETPSEGLKLTHSLIKILTGAGLFIFLLVVSMIGLPLLAGAQTCRPDGDVTQDGALTAADALRVFQQALSLADPPLNACELSVADVYPQPGAPDGNITAADALCIFQRALGLPSCLDAPTLQPVTLTTRLDQSVTYDIPIGDPLNYRILMHPLQGTATLNADGSVTYSPQPGAVGEDDFEIEVDGSSVVITIDNNLAYEGQIDGVAGSFDDVEVLLTGDGVLETTSPDFSGRFKFYALPDGDYVVKVRKAGYKSSPAQAFSLDITQHDPLYAEVNRFVLEEIDSDTFVYHWEEDQSTSGYDYAAHVNEPVVVEFLDEQVEVVDESSANHLHHDYNILLVDSDSGSWTQEHAYRLLETMKTIPQKRRNPYEEQTLPASKWLLTSDHVEDDIQIAYHENEDDRTVLISEDAFVNASPRIARVEGERGVYYSQRLHHALVRFVTDNGRDEAVYEGIFQSRYGITTVIPDYAQLTRYTTGGEPASRFQEFHPEEIVQLINMFEEMPKGMHKLPELEYLVRRLDGTPHPLYGDVPAVAWTTEGYIEFMEIGFNNFSAAYYYSCNSIS